MTAPFEARVSIASVELLEALRSDASLELAAMEIDDHVLILARGKTAKQFAETQRKDVSDHA